MYPGSWIYRGFTGCKIFGENIWVINNFIIYAYYGFVMQHQILINVIIFVAYEILQRWTHE